MIRAIKKSAHEAATPSGGKNKISYIKYIRKEMICQMCEECWQTPCHPRCPNAPDPEPVCLCDYCGGRLCEGDKFFEDKHGLKACEDCVDRGTRYAGGVAYS